MMDTGMEVVAADQYCLCEVLRVNLERFHREEQPPDPIHSHGGIRSGGTSDLQHS